MLHHQCLGLAGRSRQTQGEGPEALEDAVGERGVAQGDSGVVCRTALLHLAGRQTQRALVGPRQGVVVEQHLALASMLDVHLRTQSQRRRRPDALRAQVCRTEFARFSWAAASL